MHVIWHGLDCIRIQSKDATILIDPFAGNVGIPAPRLQADLFLFTEESNPQVAAARKNEGFLVSHAGEYEFRSILIHGTAINGDKGKEIRSIYRLDVEGVALGILGALPRPLSDTEVERLENVDVLFVPIGGHGVLTAKQATEVLSQVEPRMVIPYYYTVPKLKPALDGPEAFKRDVGAKSAAAESKLRLTKKDLPDEEMRVVFLTV